VNPNQSARKQDEEMLVQEAADSYARRTKTRRSFQAADAAEKRSAEGAEGAHTRKVETRALT